MSEPPLQEWRPPGDPRNEGDDREVIDPVAQKVFDTVAGPNLRLADNLIQLSAIVTGTALGAGLGRAFAWTFAPDRTSGTVIGGVVGLLLSLFFSGFVIGLVRGILAMKR